MLHRYREILNVAQIGLVHRTLRQNLRNTPICHKLIQCRNLLRNVVGAILTILEIHGAHNNHQLIHRLFINKELSTRAIVNLTPKLVLDNADVGSTEVGGVQGSGYNIAADRILRFCSTYRSTKAEGSVVVARASRGCPSRKINPPVVHSLQWAATNMTPIGSRRPGLGTMFRGVYDYLSGNGRLRSEQERVGPAYTTTRLIGSPPPSGVGAIKHTYDIHRANDYIHFRAVVMMELLGNAPVQRRLEEILRDYMRHSTIRERYVVVRIGDWWGEFTVSGNPEEWGSLLLESEL